MNAGSKFLPDPNLVLIPHDSLGDHPNHHENYETTSDDDGDYEEHLNDLVVNHTQPILMILMLHHLESIWMSVRSSGLR